ncbi:methionyl-tRNA formyltransferase [Devriesea agamarum]|uniref:methionyl-tRNA formyltransferase n=1 Tax=Devriesea agamarum TaxID=472569 RepID=UPI00071E3DBB|nr:methionyl-tRNA formyltransferase [Devriesea agamarum]
MRLLFAGTPVTAMSSLTALLDSRHEVVAVLTRPDAPAGRGRRLTPSPIAALALDHGLPVLKPATLKDAAVRDQIAELGADCAPVVAYGNLIPRPVLDLMPRGWVNLHFSLLPAWRGAAPVQRAVLSGADQTGLTTFLLDEGMDTGPVLMQEAAVISATETSGELQHRLAVQGADLLVRTLDAWEDGVLTPQPQAEHGASHAAKLSVDQARLDARRPASEVSAHLRGMAPDPGAWASWRDGRVKLLGISEAPVPAGLQLEPGQLQVTKRAVFLGTGTAPVPLGIVAAAGKRPMPATDWARGAHIQPTERLGLADDQAVQNHTPTNGASA